MKSSYRNTIIGIVSNLRMKISILSGALKKDVIISQKFLMHVCFKMQNVSAENHFAYLVATKIIFLCLVNKLRFGYKKKKAILIMYYGF